MSKRQRVPEARVQTASVKRASTLRRPPVLSAANWQGNAKQKPLRLLGPSVAPVVLFVMGANGADLRQPTLLQHLHIDLHQLRTFNHQ